MCYWVGGGGQQRGKNVIFKNNPFPLNNTISRLFPVYSGCEISDARAFVTGFKGVSNNKDKLHLQKEITHFQTCAFSYKLLFVLSTTEMALRFDSFCHILCILVVYTHQAKPRLVSTFCFQIHDEDHTSIRMRKGQTSSSVLKK